MLSLAAAVQGITSMASSSSISGKATANLQLSGFLTPSNAICDKLAAPSQYQIRLEFFSVTSLPSRLVTMPKCTPAE